MNIYKVELDSGATLSLEEPAHHNLALLVIEGQVSLNDDLLDNGDFALMKNEKGSFTLEGKAPSSQVFVLSGEPLNEPVIAGGPFVMNTEEELRQAYDDYSSGGFVSHDF